MLSLLWPDGSLTTARTFRELEDAVRAGQWEEYPTRRAFRAEMRRRANLWTGRSGKPIGYQTSKQFIYSLVHAEMCMLIIENQEVGS